MNTSPHPTIERVDARSLSVCRHLLKQRYAFVFAVAVAGCTFELPEPLDTPIGAGGQTSAAGAGSDPGVSGRSGGGQTNVGGALALGGQTSAGGALAPAGGGSAGAASCGEGKQTCKDLTCAETSATCESGCASCSYENADGSCTASGCELTRCTPGWVDCDGDPSNGCEESFLGGGPPLVARPLGGEGPIDWSGIEQYEVREHCLGCTPDHLSAIPPNFVGAQPDRGDIQAAFQVGYRQDGLHVRVKLFDDDFVLDSEDSPRGPREVDHVELLYRGPPEAPDPGADDRYLYIDHHGDRVTRSGDDYSTTTEWQGAAPTPGGCRIAVVRLSPAFLSGNDSEPKKPIEGDRFWFNVGVSDFDHAAEGGTVERQQHLFYKFPGVGYWYRDGAEGSTDEEIGSILMESALAPVVP